MILELVNNVVTERERELKRKNALLRAKIEKLEQSMTIEEAQRDYNLQQIQMQMQPGSMPPDNEKQVQFAPNVQYSYPYQDGYDSSEGSSEGDSQGSSEDSESDDSDSDNDDSSSNIE